MFYSRSFFLNFLIESPCVVASTKAELELNRSEESGAVEHSSMGASLMNVGIEPSTALSEWDRGQ